MPSAIRRILLIPSSYPTQRFPVDGIFVEDQARALSEHFDVLVYGQRVYGLRHALRGQFPPDGGFTKRGGIHLYEQRVFLPPRLNFRAAMAYRLQRAKLAFDAIKRDWGSPDVIHAHVVLPAGWIAAQLGRLEKLPVVLTEHTGPFSTHTTRSVSRALAKQALRACTKVIAVSPALADQIRCFDPTLSMDIIGNVIPDQFFKPANPPPVRAPGRPSLVLFSAALLHREKGYEYLLRAARLLIDHGFHDFEVRIGGEGPDRTRLASLLRELDLENNCRFLGMLTRDELLDEMQKCDIFVLPSLAETFGVVIGEAMACGKPILATRCGGAEFQVTGDTGMLVAPGDARALADGIWRVAAISTKYSPDVIREVVVRRFGESSFLRAISQRYEEAVHAKLQSQVLGERPPMS